MRVALFGGTFDPPHVGHLIAASDAYEVLELDEVVFVPNAVQPLKAGGQAASGPDRVQMVRLLCAGDSRFSVDDLEVVRGGLSFTVDTLREFRSRRDLTALFLLLGEDAAALLPSWRDPAAVQALAEVAVLTRDADAQVPSGMRRVGGRRVDVSSTEIRERVRTGRPLTGFVPPSVAEYIVARGLYREDEKTRRREDEKTGRREDGKTRGREDDSGGPGRGDKGTRGVR